MPGEVAEKKPRLMGKKVVNGTPMRVRYRCKNRNCNAEYEEKAMSYSQRRYCTSCQSIMRVHILAEEDEDQ